MVCNGIKTRDNFKAKMDFDITLIEYEADTSWVQKQIIKMKKILDSKNIPSETPHCEHCAYLREGNNFNS